MAVRELSVGTARILPCLLCLAFLFACAEPPRAPVKPPAGVDTPAPTLTPLTPSLELSVGGSGGGAGGASSKKPGTSSTRPTSTSRVPSLAAQLASGTDGPANTTKPRPFKESRGLAGFEEVALLYPAPATSNSLEVGGRLYKKYCDSCHGPAGFAPSENGNLARYAMADLRRPADYKYGDGKRALFRTIAYGTPDSPMAGYKASMTDAEIWDLVHFITRRFQNRLD